MLIRTEAPADILIIDQLLKRTFPTDSEANLVMSLRENSNLTLALVACEDDGEVIGYVMFSPVTLNGDDIYWQGLAPLAVLPEYQGKGIGKSLIKEGLSSLADFSYPACVVLGDPAFYGSLGFQNANQLGFSCQWDSEEHPGAFQIIEITPDSLSNTSGEINYCTEFNLL